MERSKPQTSETVKAPSMLLSLQLLDCLELLLALRVEMDITGGDREALMMTRGRENLWLNDVVAIIDTCVSPVWTDKLLLPITSCRCH
ncbi:hypothetical protein TNIN_92561 [Trichonephila inaurata madagascariensis]|uniref:Uncharacterized protein n=1 Tax=Trichonephila inaurata madagascariensis TaxID=2747483 RepID=A0A8X7CN31_9ARAC|nr:hypothetical protein TNIN_92561 [Trichonephila inaurata madagascariensis]